MPAPNRNNGFTLMEVLVALAVSALVIVAIANALPRTVSQSVQRSQQVQATVHTSQLVQVVKRQFDLGTFAGFADGSGQRLTAIFANGTPLPLPQTDNLYAATALNIPGLNLKVGQKFLIATTTLGKIETVKAVSGSTVQLDCPTGLPSDGSVTVYPVQTLTLDLTSGNLTSKLDDGPVQTLASAQGLRFGYLYANKAGTFTLNPAGAPANQTSAGRLVGLMPTSIANHNLADRTASLPLDAGNLTRLLNCTENAADVPNDGRVNVTIVGLPGGLTPDVTVRGPDPSVDGRRPLASTTYQSVQPGTYSLSAQPVTAGGAIYDPVIGGSPTRLWNPWGDIFMQAKYVLRVGQLVFTVTGLPNGVQGSVHLDGPKPMDISVSNGTNSVDVPPGDYTISAGGVNDSAGGAYIPTISPNGTATVRSGVPTPVAVNYQPVQGTVAVQVTGLPPGLQATLKLSGPQPVTTPAGNGGLNISVAPGAYALSAPDVFDIAGARHKATITPPNFSVVSGRTTSVSVVFLRNSPTTPTRDPPNVILKPNQAVLLLTNNNSVNSVFLKLNMYSVNSGKLVNLGSTLIYTGTPYIIDTAYAYSVSSEGLQTEDLECGNEAGCGGGVNVGQITGSIYDTVASAVVIDTLFSGTSDPTLFALGGGTIAKYKPGGFNYFDVLQCRVRRNSPLTCS